MQPKELRIGNHIEQGVIFEIKQNVVRVKYNGRTSLLVHEEMKPIPLTEEILLKCGFDTESIPYHCINGNVVIYYSQGDFLCKYTGHEIKYLHQLQNLYYALTGTELTIKGL